jgi:hypothetical protein
MLNGKTNLSGKKDIGDPARLFYTGLFVILK